MDAIRRTFAALFAGTTDPRLNGIKVENLVGFAKVPLGIAGPLRVEGQHQRGTVFAPLATTEATLVASCARGCKALQACGGVRAAVLGHGMSRAPVFRFADVGDAVAFHAAVLAGEDNAGAGSSLVDAWRRSAESTSRFARLVKVTPHVIGKTVHVKFTYTSGDAAGQNMTTIATHKALSDFMNSPAAAEYRVVGFQLEGQMASDKKMSWGNVLEPRGVQTLVWATLTNEACTKVLGITTAELDKTMTIGREGAIRNGLQGNNINTANIMAAMFLACGQDVASVVESGWSHLTHEYNAETGELSLSLFFPSLLVGTMGGGTSLETQKYCLDLIHCSGADKKYALAETIAAFALALDLSTVSAIGNNSFSQSHERLARNPRSSRL
ncbi:hydroxymethylglutaryl-CoA reductase [Colletotrichum zoysiae]|uniref:hydroxymethylglutaryl-CoA reductase (NADPH) n=1 Tax=Colletotrichum zoysiae TaxID=1216348 RepID=A0AAD9LYI7_9PEZI|nr:hydroxymethylglutaryl-CoA reductase [Colletotrichum zoysiae]